MPATTDPVKMQIAEWLKTHSDEGFFISEVEAMARRRGLDVSQVHPVLKELAQEGRCGYQRYDFDDPHIPPEALTLVVWQENVDPVDAFHRLESKWEQWLKEFLASHRCG